MTAIWRIEEFIDGTWGEPSVPARMRTWAFSNSASATDEFCFLRRRGFHNANHRARLVFIPGEGSQSEPRVIMASDGPAYSEPIAA